MTKKIVFRHIILVACIAWANLALATSLFEYFIHNDCDHDIQLYDEHLFYFDARSEVRILAEGQPLDSITLHEYNEPIFHSLGYFVESGSNIHISYHDGRYHINVFDNEAKDDDSATIPQDLSDTEDEWNDFSE